MSADRFSPTTQSWVRLRDPTRNVGHGWAALDPQLYQSGARDTKESLPTSRSAQAVNWRIDYPKQPGMAVYEQTRPAWWS